MTASMSTKEVADLLGVSVKTVIGAASKGDVPAERVPWAGNRQHLLRFDPADVDRWCARREQAAARRDIGRSRRETAAERRRFERAEQHRRAVTRQVHCRRKPRWSDVHRAELDAAGFVQAASGVRFPVEPLLTLCPNPFLRLGRSLGVNARMIHRAVDEGLTWRMADRWAVALGYHPAEVWSHAWYEAP